MDEIVWKCSVAFLLGVATQYLLATHVCGDHQNQAANEKRPKEVNKPTRDAQTELDSDSEGGDAEWEGKDEASWQPHKMVLCVRTDLKMGKGKIAAQCCHATLGAYKRAVKRTPNAIKTWEMLGQAKVCLKVDSEQELLALADRAAAAGLVHYLVVDAGRTQIAPDTKTVLGIGPAPVSAVDQVSGHLKLM